jgi:protein TonB
MSATAFAEEAVTRRGSGYRSPLLLQSLVLTRPKRHAARHTATLVTSLVLHTALVAAIILLPLLTYDWLPPEEAARAFFVQPLELAPPPPPPPPPAPLAARVAATRAPRLEPEPARFVAPIDIPTEIQPEEALDLGFEGGEVGGVEGGVPGGVVGGIVGGLPQRAPPPPPAAVRVGGRIKEPAKLKHVDPAYPELARVARVQGVVILECLISPRGRVTEVKVLSSVPLLDQAAVEAVRQWVYTPTLLNSVPVPVIMTITVTFHLK